MTPATNRHQSRQYGFTLVELLVYFVLFSILLVVITNLFISALEQRTRDSARSALQQESEFLLARLQYDITNADAILHPDVSGEESTTLVLTVDGVTSTYAVVNDRLTITRAGFQQALTSNQIRVDNLVFENQSGSTTSQTLGVTLTLTPVSQNVQQTGTRTITTSYSLR